MTPLLSVLGLLGSTARADAMLGVDLVPFGRADLAWWQAGQFSGLLVTETDGMLSPPLTAWGGWSGERVAVLLGFTTARVATITWVDADPEPTRTSLVSGALRPSLDGRRYLGPADRAGPRAWLGGGLYGVIPLVKATSDTWTDAEAASYAETAQTDRGRIQAIGARLGGGAEVEWRPGCRLGARYFVVGHRGQATTTDTVQVSTLLSGEAALTLSFSFGGATPVDSAAGDAAARDATPAAPSSESSPLALR